jgi:uncharacterized membrane protein (DUF485 family)
LRPFTARNGVPYGPRNPAPIPEKGGDTMTANVTSTAPPDPAAYEAIQATPEFVELRRRLRGFIFPMTVAFFAWYALYVVLSAYARDFMSTEVIGNINVALVFGLLQFVTTFLIAWLYERFSQRRIDPLAEEVRGKVGREVSR